MWIFQHAAVLLLVAGCLAFMCRPGPVSHDPAQGICYPGASQLLSPRLTRLSMPPGPLS